MTKVEEEDPGPPRSGHPQVFNHLECKTQDAVKTFTELQDCTYANKYLADSGQEEVMTCECKPQWDPDSCQNMACGSDSDCINRLTSIECLHDNNTCGDNCQNMRFQRHQYAPVSVIQTELKGFGLRIDSNVAQGTFIYEYIGQVIDEFKFRKRMVQYDQQGIKHFYFMMLQKGEFIDATTHGCLARFCNHSCNPNCYVDKWVVGEKLRMGIFAKRSLVKGEEITFDYNVDRYGAQAQPCYCGEPNCIGFIGGKTQTEAPSKLAQVYVDALGIDDQDEDEWYKRTASSKLKQKRSKRAGETDEDYVDSIQTKPLPESQVSKVMSSLVQCKEPWLIAKLLSRIQMASTDAHVQRLVMKMHGYQILGTVLREHTNNDGIVIGILNILLSWPRLTKNKISSSKIESTVKEISHTSENETAAKLANELVSEWDSLQMAYRIPRRERPVVVAVKQEEKKPDPEPKPQQVVTKPIQKKRPPHQIRNKPKPLLLPPGWSQAQESNGKTYYYNRQRNISQWEFPIETPQPQQSHQAENNNKVDLQKIIEEANRQLAGKQQEEAAQQEAQAAANLEQERIAKLERLKRRKEKRRKRKNKLLLQQEKTKSSESETRSSLTRAFAEYVPNQVKKASHDALTRERIKKYSKDIVKILVEKEMRPGHVIKDATRLSSEKRAKVKGFIDMYMGKVLARVKERQGGQEEEEEEGEEDSDSDDSEEGEEEDGEEDDEDSEPAEETETPTPPLPTGILHNTGSKKRPHKVTFAQDVVYEPAKQRPRVE